MAAAPHTVVIVNPSSSGGRTGRAWASLAGELRAVYGDFEDCYTAAPGDGTRLARQALREGASTIVAVGGDGSINEVVNGFFEQGTTSAASVAVNAAAVLGVIPLGTGGDFIRSIGVPRDPVLAASALANAGVRRIDIGRIEFVDHQGAPAVRHFINVASFGIAGLVDKYVNASKTSLSRGPGGVLRLGALGGLGGTLSFALATLRAGVTYRNSPVRVRIDGGPWHDGPVYNVSVANGRFFGGGMKVAPAALLDDGAFELVRFGDMGLLDLLKDGRSLYSGKHLDLAEVSTARARTVEAESTGPREVLLDVDGEQPGRLPARFSILPGALALRCPELPT